jgi:hypothetical protein
VRDSWRPGSSTSSSNSKGPRRLGFKPFVGLVLLLVALGIVRSAIATRLDGFTLDEAYHIAAGVSYVRYGDFRINPEHPPSPHPTANRGADCANRAQPAGRDSTYKKSRS